MFMLQIPIRVVKKTKLTLEYQKCGFQRMFGGLMSSTTFQATWLRKCWSLWSVQNVQWHYTTTLTSQPIIATKATFPFSHANVMELFLVPSWSVYVVECVDKVARTELCIWQCTSKEINVRITVTVLHEMTNRMFLSIQEHSLQCHVLDEHLRDDHITALIKLIVKHYLVIFYHQFGTIYTEHVLKANK